MGTPSLEFSQTPWSRDVWRTWDRIRDRGTPLRKDSKYTDFLTIEVPETDPLVPVIRAAILYPTVKDQKSVPYLCPKWEKTTPSYDKLWERINGWLTSLLDKETSAAALHRLNEIFPGQTQTFKVPELDPGAVQALPAHKGLLNRKGVPNWFELFLYPTEAYVKLCSGAIHRYFETFPDSVILLARVLARLYQNALVQVQGILAKKAARLAARQKAERAEKRCLQFVSDCFFDADKKPKWSLRWRWEEVKKSTNELVKREEEEKEEKEEKEFESKLTEIYDAFAKDHAFAEFLGENLGNLMRGLGYSFAIDAAGAIPGIGPVIQVAIAATDIKGAVEATVNSSAAQERAERVTKTVTNVTNHVNGVRKLKSASSSATGSPTIAGAQIMALCVEDLAKASRQDALKEMGVSVSAAMLALVPGIPAAVSASGKLGFRLYGFLASVYAEYLAMKSWKALITNTNRQPKDVMSAYQDFDWMKAVVVQQALAVQSTAKKSSGQKPVEQAINGLGGEVAEYIGIADVLEKLNNDISETKEAVDAEWQFFANAALLLGREEDLTTMKENLRKWVASATEPKYLRISRFTLTPLRPAPPAR
jgi:hypothetical protein